MSTASGKTASYIRDTADLKLGEHRGKRRVWLEGKRLTDIGFGHGVRYQVGPATDGGLEVRLSTDGPRTVSGSVGRPVIELLSAQVAEQLGQVDRVQAWFTEGQVLIQLHPLDRMVQGRLTRLNRRLHGGQPMRVGSLCHGGGVATSALMSGLAAAGLEAELTFAQDIDARYLEQSKTHGPLSKGGISIEADLGDLDPRAVPEVDVLEAGLPCVSASRAGRAKKQLAQPEDDDKTADLAAAFLEVIRATQPAVIVLENVPEYSTSASAAMIRRRLGRWGYVLHEHVVDGSRWSLEARTRWVLVAVTQGLVLDLADLQQDGPRPVALGEVLDASTPASAWGTTEGKDRKQAADKAKGNRFQQRFLDASSTSVPTLRRGYIKNGSTDPRLRHPSRPGYSRLLSSSEHARIKGVPAELLTGLSETVAHEVLGQSVIRPAFVALGHLVGAALA